LPLKCTGYNRELQDDLVAAVDAWIAAGRPGARGNPSNRRGASAKSESRSPSISRLRSPKRFKSEPESSDEELVEIAV
jgi:hypothetical protein